MKLNILKNPYTSGEEEPPCHHIQVNIATTEWMKLFNGLPFHGVQDSFFATLYQKFLELVGDELPTSYDMDSEEIIVALLKRLSIKPKDKTPAFSGGTERIRKNAP